MAEDHIINEWQRSNAFRAGEESAYDYFFRQYFAVLCSVAHKLVDDKSFAEDIVQDCFLKLWQNRSKMKDAVDIRSYLYTTVRNASIDFLRKEKRNRQRKASFAQTLDSDVDNGLEHMVIQAELLREIYHHAQQLPQRTREVFELYYDEGKTYPEISALLHTGTETIRKQKARAIAILKDFLLCVTFFFQ